MQKELNAVVVENQPINDALFLLRVKPQDFEIPDFKPGQFATLGLPNPDDENGRLLRRAYSISSSNKEKDFLEFYIALVKDGALTPKLQAMKSGQKVWIAPKITGLFTIEPVSDNKNLILVATGTGLGPYISMLLSDNLGNTDQKVTVIHGVRQSWDLGYRQQLEALCKDRKNLFYHPIVSRAEGENSQWEGLKGRIPIVWDQIPFESEWGETPTPDTTHVFLCGNPEMIKNMTSLLEEKNFKVHKRKEPGQIHTEKYW